MLRQAPDAALIAGGQAELDRVVGTPVPFWSPAPGCVVESSV